MVIYLKFWRKNLIGFCDEEVMDMLELRYLGILFALGVSSVKVYYVSIFSFSFSFLNSNKKY
jgi:hypothetical protein